MFITNKLSPVEMFEELIKKRPLSRNATARFKGLEHDKHLCPAFEERIASILEAYKAYGSECHDIQGMRDDGVDILLKHDDLDEKPHRVGLQVKSYREIEDWKQKKDTNFISRLKSQYATAKCNAKVERYYIVLCADAVRHGKQARMVASEFKNFDDATIITPGQALSFYEMTPVEVEMGTIRTLCHRDPVLREAENEINGETGIYAYVLVYLLCEAYEGDTQLSMDKLGEILNEWIEFGGEDDADDLGTAVARLENAEILKYEGLYSINPTAFPLSLSALYFDVRFRRRVAASEAFEHMSHLLDLAAYANREKD